MIRINLFNRNPDMATDPVCDMQVDMKKPNGGTYEHEGDTYYFCGPGCNRAFQKEPAAYLSGEKKIEM
ncbi:MAG: YHS domain-containing protein [Chloroflexi bacterium]|nr:YHS domain-containing protein [Chloroflexota bacterium]